MVKRNKKKLAKMVLACSMALSTTLNTGFPIVQASSSENSYILKDSNGKELTQFSLYEYYDAEVTFQVNPNCFNLGDYRVDTDGNGTYDFYGNSNDDTFTLKGVAGKDVTCMVEINSQIIYVVMHNPNETYKITYNLAGGVNDSANPSTYKTSDRVILQKPTRKGYTFTGWYNKELGSPTTSVVIGVGSKGDKTYTATWVPTTYTIEYELDGGVNSSKNPTRYKITDGNITLYDPTKEGCEFLGWYYDAEYKSKAGYISSQSCESYVLYAKWKTIVTEVPTTAEITTEKVTEAPTTAELTTEKVTEAPTTAEVTTEKVTEAPTTAEVTTEKVTEVPTTAEVTTEKVTTEKVTEALTTAEVTTEKVTTEKVTEAPTTA